MEFVTDWVMYWAQRPSSIFFFILVAASSVFFLTEMFWWVSGRKHLQKFASFDLPSDDSRLESLWTVAPALVLLVLCSVRAPQKDSQAHVLKRKAVEAVSFHLDASHQVTGSRSKKQLSQK